MNTEYIHAPIFILFINIVHSSTYFHSYNRYYIDVYRTSIHIYTQQYKRSKYMHIHTYDTRCMYICMNCKFVNTEMYI